MPSFNLVDQPWIPALSPDDPVPRLVSLREALLRAHEIQAISDPSPLVTISLHRLLLAIVHRCFGPKDAQSWTSLWASGAFEASTINRYLDKCRHHFDLFDAERPFYQTPGLPEAKASSSAILIHEVGNPPWDHSAEGHPPTLSADQAARAIIALQAFDLGGLVWREPNAKSPSAAASHLMGSAVFLTIGDSLFETLLLNAIRVDPAQQLPFGNDEAEDVPAWEQDKPAALGTRDADGYLDFLTWQSRRILLFPDDIGGRPTVSKAIVGAGWRFPDSLDLSRRETMVPYSKNLKAKPKEAAVFPMTFFPEQALWRNCRAILGFGDSERPQTLEWLKTLRGDNIINERVLKLFVGGVKPVRQRKIVRFWRSDQLDLPTQYLIDATLVAELEMGLKAAEDAGRALRQASYRLAATVLEPDGAPDRARVDALISALAPERTYWPALDIPFRQHIVALPDDIGAHTRLAEAILRAANEAWDSACDAVATNGRGFQAVAQASPLFRGLLYAAVRPLRPEAPTDMPGAEPEEALS